MSNGIYYLQIIIAKAVEIFSAIWLYIIIGVIIGELLKFTSWIKLIDKALAKSTFFSVIIAAIVGVVSPLCTFGTVPVVLQLYKKGVNIAPLVVFLAVSSLMNPQLFFYTWGGLGLEMALVRVTVVLIFGILLGIILYKIPFTMIVNRLPEDENAETDRYVLAKNFSWIHFLKNTWKSIEFVGFYFLLGIFLGAMVEVLAPVDWITFSFKSDSWMGVFLAALAGMPLYSCGGGTIPLIRSFMQMGMSKGAALAFFLVGPATRITPIMALATLLRPYFIVLYLLLLIGFSMIAGLIYR